MRVRTRWTPSAVFLWVFVAIVAGFLAWIEARGRADAPPPPEREPTVDFEVVE